MMMKKMKMSSLINFLIALNITMMIWEETKCGEMSWKNLLDYKSAKTLFICLIPNPHSTPPECLLLTPVLFSLSQLQPFYLFAGLFLSYGYNRSS
jgi:hypothetical protein